jgi:hypothetical protein
MYRSRYHRRLSAACVPLVLAGGVVVAAVAGTSSAARAEEPLLRRAICAERACIVVVDLKYDRDGDGVTDEDEVRLGSDPDDASSTPDARRMIEGWLDRTLPSFDRHLTELVVLPTKSPDGLALETGLGEFKLRDGDGDLLKSIGVVVKQLDHNGFEAILGLRLARVRDGDTAPQYPFDEPEMIGKVDTAWYSSGKGADITSFGVNAGKTETGRTSEWWNPHNNMNKDYSGKLETITYSDGSKDKVVTTSEKGSGIHAVEQKLTSENKDGKKTGEVAGHGRQWVDEDGTKHTVVEYEKPIKDDKGNVIGTEKGKVEHEKHKDGSTKVTAEVTKTMKDGSKEITKTTTECKSDCPEEGKQYTDPDYVGFVIPTAEDWERVKIRVTLAAMPVDDGDGGFEPPAEPPTAGYCTPACVGDPALILIDPDGVVIISPDDQPAIAKIVATPEYVVLIDGLAHQTGFPFPPTGTGIGGGGR